MTKVLVVDDTPDMAKLILRAVRDQGYEAFSAGDGRRAIELAAAELPDVVLLDVMMPGMTGIEVLRRMKADEQLHRIPVILVSAKSEDRDIIEGLEAGAHDYITKPFKREILAARLRTAIRVRQSQEKLAQVNERLVAEIAERKRKEQELVQAQKLESIGHLAAGIAHEINTPAQYVGDNLRFLHEASADVNRLLEGLTRLLDAAKSQTVSKAQIAEIDSLLAAADLTYLTGEIPNAIRQSLEGIDKVATIVRAMKEFSHPGSDKMQVIDLNRAIESTLVVCRNEWKYVADVVTEFESDLPHVPCFPNEFNQVILNLVVNAAQAIGNVLENNSSRKGTISIATLHDSGWAEIRIQDSGSGIPEGIQPKVFDHFFTTKEVGKGTGQGLTIARSIVVEKHGGTLEFETEVGRGSTFIVRLPIGEAVRPQESSSAEIEELIC